MSNASSEILKWEIRNCTSSITINYPSSPPSTPNPSLLCDLISITLVLSLLGECMKGLALDTTLPLLAIFSWDSLYQLSGTLDETPPATSFQRMELRLIALESRNWNRQVNPTSLRWEPLTGMRRVKALCRIVC